VVDAAEAHQVGQAGGRVDKHGDRGCARRAKGLGRSGGRRGEVG
jgi:hypothetical protein